MVAFDFIYADEYLSDYGFILCNFDEASLETVTAGSEVTMNTVSIADGRQYALTSVKYETCYETTLQICKLPTKGGTQKDMFISDAECRELMRWLNRKQFLKFKLLDNAWENVYVEATFNISRIEFDEHLYGLELQMITNRPFALKEPTTEMLSFTSSDYSTAQTIEDESDEIGYIYPSNMTITCGSSGTLSITNDIEDRRMEIANCTSGEVIILDCRFQVVESSLDTHDVANDFNYSFFRLANTYTNRKNNITVSMPCEISITYEPISKVVF